MSKFIYKITNLEDNKFCLVMNTHATSEHYVDVLIRNAKRGYMREIAIKNNYKIEHIFNARESDPEDLNVINNLLSDNNCMNKRKRIETLSKTHRFSESENNSIKCQCGTYITKSKYEKHCKTQTHNKRIRKFLEYVNKN